MEDFQRRGPMKWIYVWEWANVLRCSVLCRVCLAILASPPHHPSAPSPLRIVWDEKQPFSRDKYLWSGWNCLKTILKTSSLTRIFQSVPFQLPADKTRVARAAFYIRIQLHHTHSWMENILWSVKSPKIRIKRIHNCALKWELTWIFVVWKWKVWYPKWGQHRAQQYHPAFTTHNVCGVMEAALKANIVNCPTNG